jgi:DNA-binding CsgD family transcriptional regulator
VRCAALTLIARLRVRRGDPAAMDTVRESWRQAVRLRECQRIAPAAATLAEAADLDGDASAVVEEVQMAYDQAQRHGTPGVRAELAYWLGRAGRPVPGGGHDHPYATLADGDWQAAAETWRAAGLRYEYAAALSASPHATDLLTALSELDALGAEPLARRVRAHLKDLGVARVPRGPAATTRINPAGLTERQAEVVRLMSDGLTNAEIAEHLVLSVRTVDSHVAAALTKLGARTRKEAAARFLALGGTSPH